MGTHPIFESDFDCLTDCSKMLWRCQPLRHAKRSTKPTVNPFSTRLSRPGIGPFLAVNALIKTEDEFGELREAIDYAIRSRNPYEHGTIDRLAIDYRDKMVSFSETRDELANETDEEMRAALNEEIDQLAVEMAQNESELSELLSVGALLQNEPEKVTLEIVAGAGGDSAGMSVEELHRLYCSFCAHMGWEIESEEIDEGSLGYDRVEMVISGEDCSVYLDYEKGVHRIQRIPPNSGSIQTNTIQVKVMPLLSRTTISIPRKDLELSATTGTGKGGQKINRAHLCAVVKHVPSGVTVTHFESGKCGEARTNALEYNTKIAIQKLTAMLQRKSDVELEARLLGLQQGQVSQMERSDRIRNYQHEQGRLTCYKLDRKLKLRDFFGPNGPETLQQLAEEYMDKMEDDKLDSLFKRFDRDIGHSENGQLLLEKLKNDRSVKSFG